MAAPNPPRPALTLRHVALRVEDLATCERFYVDVLGMTVEWRPDEDNVYLTGGGDNLALHREPAGVAARGALDHLGFVVRRPEDVDAWAQILRTAGVDLASEPRTHRDGARSLYVHDPAGNLVQIIYHPPLASAL